MRGAQGERRDLAQVRRRPEFMLIDSPQHSHLLHARSLRFNILGPEGGAALADGLKGNSTLQSLE